MPNAQELAEQMEALVNESPPDPPPRILEPITPPIWEKATVLAEALLKSHPRQEEAVLAHRLTRLLSHPQSERFPLVRKRLEATEARQKYPLATAPMVEEGIRHAVRMGMNVVMSNDHRRIWIHGVPTPPITMTEEDERVVLGIMTPSLRFERRLGGTRWKWDVMVEADEPNYSHNEHFHPHADPDGYLCLGDIANDVNRFVYECQFDSALFLIADGLAQYNPDSPYQAIAEWNHPKYSCNGCGCDYNPEEEGGTSEDGDHYCNECGVLIEDQWFYIRETTVCEVCDHRRHDDDMRTCPCCDDSVCRRCLEDAL